MAKLDTTKEIKSVSYNGTIVPLLGLTPIPKFSYTGEYEAIYENEIDWKIYLKTSGNIKFEKDQDTQVFLVGGGGAGSSGGSSAYAFCGTGGNGGFTKTESMIFSSGKEYSVIIGEGGIATSGSNGGDGGNTSIGDILVSGGKGGSKDNPTYSVAVGGSGGGGGGYLYSNNVNGYGGKGGYDGSNGCKGGVTSHNAIGQGSTTREFGESSGKLYAGGGGGGGINSFDSSTGAGAGGKGGGGNGGCNGTDVTSGEANTGGGGGGGTQGTSIGGNGGSGIIVIRNIRV